MIVKTIPYILLACFCTITFSYAQPGGGGNPGHGQAVPLQGLAILLLAGALIGIRKITGRVKNK